MSESTMSPAPASTPSPEWLKTASHGAGTLTEPAGEARFLVTAFEAGVPFEGHLAESTNRYAADDWSNVFEWGDVPGERPVTRHNARSNPNPPYVHAGTWQLWDESHVYAAPGIYSARVTVRIHVYGTPPGTHPFPSPLTAIAVYPRIPVAAVQIEPDPSNAGDMVRVEIRLVAPASPAGSRIDLTAEPVGAFVDLPAFVRVPAGQTLTVLSYRLAKPAPTRKAKLTARSIGAARSDEVQVLP